MVSAKSKLERLFREATGFHKTTCLIASKFTGRRIFDADEHQPFPMLFRNEKGILVRSVFRDSQAEEEWVKDSDSYFTALIVNGAFSLELHLKHLYLLIEKKEVRGHNLFKFFRGLSDYSRANLNAIFTAISSTQPLIEKSFRRINEEMGTAQRWNIETVLEASAEAFEKWRYCYEGDSSTTSFAGYGEAVFAMRTMSTQYKG